MSADARPRRSHAGAGWLTHLATGARRHPGLIWVVVVVAHVWPPVLAALWGWNAGLGDPGLYAHWMHEARETGSWPLIDEAWVYPPGAFHLMLPLLAVPDPASAPLIWIAVSFILNVVVIGRLLERPGGVLAAWWWAVFLVACGPLAVSRLESVTAPLTLLAILSWHSRPVLGASVASLAGWIKLAPFVWLVPMVLFRMRRAGAVIAAFVLVTAAVVVPLVVLGGSGHVLSFLSSQGARGLQMESPWALGLQVQRLFGAGVEPVFDEHWGTVQFVGAYADRLAGIADVVLPLLVVAALALVVRAAWLRRGDRDVDPQVVIASGLLLTCPLVLANKVGSPQFTLWFAPAVAAMIVLGADRVLARRWAVAGLLLAAVTQIEYPLRLHGLDADPLGITALCVRHAVGVYFLVSSARVVLRRTGTRRT